MSGKRIVEVRHVFHMEQRPDLSRDARQGYCECGWHTKPILSYTRSDFNENQVRQAFFAHLSDHTERET